MNNLNNIIFTCNAVRKALNDVGKSDEEFPVWFNVVMNVISVVLLVIAIGCLVESLDFMEEIKADLEGDNRAFVEEKNYEYENAEGWTEGEWVNGEWVIDGEAKTIGNYIPPVRIAIYDSISNKSLLDANGGLTTAPYSLNAQNGINVEYVLINDVDTSARALISEELQGAVYTVNRYAFMQERFEEANIDAVMPFIISYSNGADGIIAKNEITSINDLIGKKIAVPKFYEAQTLVEWLLNNSSLTEADKNQIRNDMVFCQNPDEVARAFFNGEVEAAATWEPYLSFAAKSTDYNVLFDTSMNTNLVFEGVVFRADFVSKNKEFMTKFIDTALQASSMYEDEFDNIRMLPYFELMDDEQIIDMGATVEFATLERNRETLNSAAAEIYEDMANIWKELGEEAYPENAKTAFSDEFVTKTVNDSCTA